MNPFSPSGATANIAVTATTQNEAIPIIGTGSTTIRVHVGGSQDVFLEFGDSNVVATLAASMPVGAGHTEVFGLPPSATHYAVIAASTGSTLYVTPGNGA